MNIYIYICEYVVYTIPTSGGELTMVPAMFHRKTAQPWPKN